MILLTVILIGAVQLINEGGWAGNVPQGYRSAAETDLSQAEPEGQVLYAFDKTETGPLSVLLIARNIRTDFIDLTITGPQGWSSVILHGEEFSASENRSNPTWEQLPAGHYELILRGTPARGKITVYLKP